MRSLYFGGSGVDIDDSEEVIWSDGCTCSWLSVVICDGVSSLDRMDVAVVVTVVVVLDSIVRRRGRGIVGFTRAAALTTTT